MRYLFVLLMLLSTPSWATQLTPKGCQYYAGLVFHYASKTIPDVEFVQKMRKMEEGDPETEDMMYRMMEFVDKNKQEPITHAEFFYRQCVEAQGHVNEIYSFGRKDPKQNLPQSPASSRQRISLP